MRAASPMLSFSVSSLSLKAGHRDPGSWSRAVAFEAGLLPLVGRVSCKDRPGGGGWLLR